MSALRRCRAAAIVLLLAVQPAAGSDAVSVAAEAFAFTPLQTGRTGFGRLELLAALRLTCEDRRFGGYSGLVLSPDGRRLIAVSDDGWLFTAFLHYSGDRLSGLGEATIAPLTAPDGKRPRAKWRRDSEALAVWDERGIDGQLLVGFESQPRLERIDPAGVAPTIRFSVPEPLARGPANGELEALARFQDGPRKGWLIALSERNFDAEGNIRGWLWKDAHSEELRLQRHADYAVTDMALMAGGETFITIERSFSPPTPPGMAMRLFTLPAGPTAAPLAGELLFEGRQPLYAVDNMEGLALHRDAGGRLIVTVISDDNFNRALQRTIILQFRLKE